MPLIPFPRVPNVPGVPQIPRSVNIPTSAEPVLSVLQSVLWQSLQIDNQWGIYDSNGNSLFDPNSITGLSGLILGILGATSSSTNAVGYSKETRISDFPIETGNFANYNKVETPASPVVTFCMGGSDSDRSSFLTAIDAATKSTDLYSVVTPEVTYVDYSLERYNYERRNSKGANILIVEIGLKEIRQVSAQYTVSNKNQISDPKNPSSSAQIDNGTVQTQIPKTSTLKSLSNKIPALTNTVNSFIQGF